jgi:N-acetylmuramic acid 6-phosphate etherase
LNAIQQLGGDSASAAHTAIVGALFFTESKRMDSEENLVLGVEGGGTKTDWVLLDRSGRVLREGQLRAANLKISTDAQFGALFQALPREATCVGVFLAGCLLESDRARVRRLVTEAWPNALIVVGNDRESGMATALGDGDGIVVISGTGAVVHGRLAGRVEKAGGWGHILGDRGGGYDMCRHALRKVMLRYDLDGARTPLATAILGALNLNELPQLVDWANQADKMQVARLAPVVLRAAQDGDVEMRTLVEHRARDLADFTQAVARRLGMETPEVRMLGGLLTKEPFYASLYRDFLSTRVPGARVEACTRSGAFGAAALAISAASVKGADVGLPRPVVVAADSPPAASPSTAELAAATTEQLHPRAAELERMEAMDLVSLFVTEEGSVQSALAACAEKLAAAVELVVAALGNGGRLFHVGAGTSGRLGVLDASEIPPTFGTDPELVQGIIAGGAPALIRSIEAAEDAPEAGALALIERGVREGDVVCGIAASGRTPFVLGALARAREVGARTVLLSCNPTRVASARPWDIEIDLPTGPEIVAGSTRLKAGTATKVTLNILTTCAMIRLGKVRGGAMVDMRATNAKLRVRAIRIVSTALECDPDQARARLERNQWNIREALEGTMPAAGGRD